MDKTSSAVSRVTGKMPEPDDDASGASGVASSVAEAATSAVTSVGDVLPDADQVKHQAQQAVSVAQENPIGLLAGSAAVGFLAGMLLPRTRMEDEKIGELSDQVKQTASEAGQEALQHGKDAAQTAIETAKDNGASHQEDLSSSVQQMAKETNG